MFYSTGPHGKLAKTNAVKKQGVDLAQYTQKVIFFNQMNPHCDLDTEDKNQHVLMTHGG